MKRSTNRILTTHIGSLPRPPELLKALTDRDADPQGFEQKLKSSVADVVRRQAETGIDIIDDGEFGKPGFIHYINQRLSGFEPGQVGGDPFAGSREHLSFPGYYGAPRPGGPNPSAAAVHMVCTGPISYRGQAELQRDIDNLKAAASGLDVEELFMPAVSPTSVEMWQENQYYRTQEEYLFAIADALHEEYAAIANAGIVVQIDDPHLSMYYMMRPETTVEDVRRWAAVRVEAVNQALKGIPRDMVRWHTCYGINVGPRVHDLELKHIVDLILRIDAGGYSFEAANPRHEHEWRIWEDTKLPDGAVLIPGVITQSSVLVEHPELVAQRIVRYAGLVGRENVVAGADCGFGTFAGLDEIHESIVWAKLESLVEGARIASRELWR
ncbi:MAG TPA: cobalamin-independent methionine synthase II family protein [Dehalococcoidia bacterium]|nr:cobalamin-independent methionine synthase II family protein [Dehalococcoidia bacterium]